MTTGEFSSDSSTNIFRRDFNNWLLQLLNVMQLIPRLAVTNHGTTRGDTAYHNIVKYAA